MINRIKNKYLKDQTKSLMNSMKGCKHAIYGLCYYTPEGNIVEEIADNAQEARYFYDDQSFNQCIDIIHQRYDNCGCEYLNIYCVHKAE